MEANECIILMRLYIRNHTATSSECNSFENRYISLKFIESKANLRKTLTIIPNGKIRINQSFFNVFFH